MHELEPSYRPNYFIKLNDSLDLNLKPESGRGNQSHYREVLRWDISMEHRLRFGLDLGLLALLKKNWADYKQLLRPFFSCFHGQKKLKKNKNIVMSTLKSCIK